MTYGPDITPATIGNIRERVVFSIPRWGSFSRYIAGGDPMAYHVSPEATGSRKRQTGTRREKNLNILAASGLHRYTRTACIYITPLLYSPPRSRSDATAELDHIFLYFRCFFYSSLTILVFISIVASQRRARHHYTF